MAHGVGFVNPPGPHVGGLEEICLPDSIAPEQHRERRQWKPLLCADALVRTDVYSSKLHEADSCTPACGAAPSTWRSPTATRLLRRPLEVRRGSPPAKVSVPTCSPGWKRPPSAARPASGPEGDVGMPSPWAQWEVNGPRDGLAELSLSRGPAGPAGGRRMHRLPKRVWLKLSGRHCGRADRRVPVVSARRHGSVGSRYTPGRPSSAPNSPTLVGAIQRTS